MNEVGLEDAAGRIDATVPAYVEYDIPDEAYHSIVKAAKSETYRAIIGQLCRPQFAATSHTLVDFVRYMFTRYQSTGKEK